MSNEVKVPPRDIPVEPSNIQQISFVDDFMIIDFLIKYPRSTIAQFVASIRLPIGYARLLPRMFEDAFENYDAHMEGKLHDDKEVRSYRINNKPVRGKVTEEEVAELFRIPEDLDEGETDG